jgi:hypothetical protein
MTDTRRTNLHPAMARRRMRDQARRLKSGPARRRATFARELAIEEFRDRKAGTLTISTLLSRWP